VNGQNITYRAFENRVYVQKPVDVLYQTINIYVPEAYYHDQSINGYTAKTAPIFLPNTVGGYMPGAAGTPGEDRRRGGPDAALTALSRGLVVAEPGARGRTLMNAKGEYTGKAPALIVDMKAAIRYLRCNKDRIPGDTEKIISNGTSAGGALSALIGATGNSKDYVPYLQALGAATERDDIFASMDYCPITNLNHADMAYEWVFSGVNDFHQRQLSGMMPAFLNIHGKIIPLGPGPVILNPNKNQQKGNRPDNAPADTTDAVPMSVAQIMASKQLKALFPSYVNSLGLKDKNGVLLTLDAQGNGTFKDYIKGIYMASAQKAVDSGTDLSKLNWLTIKNGKVTDMDLGKYAVYATRLKATPAFDSFDLSSGENDEFGTMTVKAKHFTAYSQAHSTIKTVPLADAKTVKLLNPMDYIGQAGTTVAPHWRIRHGAVDRDTAMPIPAILALKLMNSGYDVDFASPWGYGHDGDYDLPELFDWIDKICKK
jgi:dienelactone hydrolase